MSSVFAGSLAAALSVFALVLAPSRSFAIVTPVAHPDDEALRDAGWVRPLGAWEALRLAAVLGAALLAFIVGVPLPVAVVPGAVAPSVALRLVADARRARARQGSTRIVQAAHAVLRSGAALPEALRRATAGSVDPIARRPFEAALRMFDLGAPLDDALRDAARRVGDDQLRIALETIALGVGERLAVERTATLVGAVADRLAFLERLEAEVRARTSGLRTQVWLLAAVVPCLALYLAFTLPGLAATLTGPLGRTALLPVATLLEVTGIVLSRRFVSAVVR